MSPETFSAVLGGLTDGVAGAVLGFLFAVLLLRLTRKRKLVEYYVSSIPLFRLKPVADSLVTVSASKEAFTGNPVDRDEMLPLKTVYGFEILLTVGNEDIEKIDDIEIRLDTEAKIVRCDTDPQSTPGYSITAQKESAYSNVIHLSVPYLNAKTSLAINLITTENTNRSCVVKVHGVGIRTRPAKSPRAILNIGATIFLTLGAISIAFFVLDATIHNQPFFYNDLLTWSSLILFFTGIATFFYFYFSYTRQETRQIFNQNWYWDIPKSSKKKKNFLQRWFT